MTAGGTIAVVALVAVGGLVAFRVLSNRVDSVAGSRGAGGAANPNGTAAEAHQWIDDARGVFELGKDIYGTFSSSSSGSNPNSTKGIDALNGLLG